jgi:hypothetical protein
LLSADDGLPAVLAPVIQALDTGAAAALKDARIEAKAQLSTENRQNIQSQLNSAIVPLNDAKNTMRTSFQTFVDPELKDNFADNADYGLRGLIGGLFVLALLVLCCGCGSVGCCWKSEEGNASQRVACATWCCNFYVAVVALFVGGFMLLIAVPVSGTCLVLADINRNMLNDIATAINLDMTGDDGIILGDMVDKCFNPPDPNVASSLLDILFERNETDGSKVTMRQKMIDEFKSKIDTVFADVENKLNTNAPSLSEDDRIQELRQALLDNPINKMYYPKSDIISSGGAFEALSSIPALAAAAQNSSAACDSHYSSLTKQGFGGITAFLDELTNVGSNPQQITNGISCTQTVTCPSGSSNAACEAGNNFMRVKAALQSLGALDSSGTAATNRYRCDKFATASGSGVCDVKDMPATITGDEDMCVTGSAGSYTMETVTQYCDLEEFTVYIQDFDTRLQKVFDLVDDETDNVKNKINVDMKGLLDNHIMNPLDDMADSMQCNFLAPLYKGVVHAFCFQGMWGFRRIAVSYTTLGFLQVFLIPLMYTIYRVGKDRHTAEDEGKGASESI